MPEGWSNREWDLEIHDVPEYEPFPRGYFAQKMGLPKFVIQTEATMSDETREALRREWDDLQRQAEQNRVARFLPQNEPRRRKRSIQRLFSRTRFHS